MDVEIVRREALETAWREAVAPHEREHTTPFIWDRPDRFRLLNVAWDSGLDLSASHRVVLDYLEDYLVIRAVYDRLSPGNPFFTLDQVVEFLDDHPEVANRNERYRNTHWYDQVRDQLQTLAQRGPS
jgi:spore coat polysaccharide biosynthesis protein SpsF